MADELRRAKGEVEIFVFTVRQRRGLTPVICAVGLGDNEGVRIHVRRPLSLLSVRVRVRLLFLVCCSGFSFALIVFVFCNRQLKFTRGCLCNREMF